MSEHEHNCDCGCDHDHQEEEMTVTLTLDDGTEMDCAVVSIFPAGEHEYIALLPMTEEQDGEVYLYRFSLDEDDNPNLENIEDDDEYELVADAFDELLDTEEFEKVFGDDDV